MLFLLNDKVIDLPAPEAHLLQRWRDMGCGDPRQLRAQDAVAFATQRFVGLQGVSVEGQTLGCQDIAALIIAKTGANSLILKPTVSGEFEPRLRHVPTLVLETYQRGAANDPGARRRA